MHSAWAHGWGVSPLGAGASVEDSWDTTARGARGLYDHREQPRATPLWDTQGSSLGKGKQESVSGLGLSGKAQESPGAGGVVLV